MKILLPILFLLITITSCNSQNKPIKENMKKNIKNPILLNDWIKEHPNKKQMEFFLNNYQYELIQLDVKFSHWKNYNPNDYRCMFINSENNIHITLLFTQNQKNAVEVGRSNFDKTTAEWTVNGSVLIIVNANDKNLVNNTLSYFSGDE